MNLRAGTPVAAAVAIAAGIFILVSLFIPGFEELRNRFLNWAVLLAALAMLLGLVNLFVVHFDRVRNKQKPLYSVVLIVAMLATFGITVWEGSQGPLATWIFSNIQFPVEASLMAVLAISLTLAATRLMQHRNDLMSIVFVITLFILLVGSGPLFGIEIPIFTRTLGPYLNQFLSTGAMRGLLIGVALGTLLTGLRILVGADRPYGG
ncbi:MAG: hypothetical protein WD740_04275 [Anaerolineales bacterium]